jgi:regulator of ribonuclease activity A
MDPIEFSTCDLCDPRKSDTDDAFRVLPEVFRSFGGRARFAGPVRTVRCFEDNTSVKAVLETPGHGAVLVVDGGGSRRRALVGGNIAASAAQNGWAGVVVHGAVRDTAEMAATDIGLLALGLIPMPSDRKSAGLVDIPLQIEGVWVRPGDWLYADADGVVVTAAPA